MAKTCNFSRKLRRLGIFMNFSERSCKKCLISWKSTRNHRFGQNYATFSNKLPCFGVSMNFSAKCCKKLTKSWKRTKNHPFGENFATFRTNYHVFAFRWIFQVKVAKSASFREKARKASISPNLCIFSNKLPCLCISMNFSGKSGKKCFISWKSTKNHRFGQNFQLFEQTTMSWHFHELFSKKLQKVPHSVGKREKSSIWPKLCNFFEQTTMSLHFDQLFGKKLRKVPHFVKQQEKSLIWPKLATFRTNHHVLAFRWTFQEKNAKSGPFREKARTLIDLAKTCNFSKKLPCFGISIIIAGKSCKKVEKVAHFAKIDEKSSIWPKLATFGGNYHVSAFLSTFQQKVSHFVKKHEKSSFGSCLAHS